MTEDSKETKKIPTQAAKKSLSISKVRKFVAPLVFLVLVAGTLVGFGFGSLSSFGWGPLSVICPIGALEVMLAGRNATAHIIIAFAVAMLITFVFGRIFCSWACPVSPLQSWFGRKKLRSAERSRRAHDAVRRDKQGGALFEEREDGRPLIAGVLRKDPRIVVLAGVLIASFLAGFPVFCLLCPVGLSFSFVFAVVTYVTSNEFTWAIIACPVVLAVELIVLRSWCHALCPIGVLLSLVGKHSPLLKPSINSSACLQTDKQISLCVACARACPEGIDLRHNVAEYDCTRCGRCEAACPVDAISFHVLPVDTKIKNERP